MQVVKFLHNFVFNALPKVHQTRLNALVCTVTSLLDQGKLTLTALGRNMGGNALVKHKIKRVDRLLGNDKLIADKFYIYKQLANNILKNLTEAVIIVDWSGCCSQQRWILQASLAMSGRSIAIYKEIHPLSVLYYSLLQDTNHFQDMGTLEMPHYEYAKDLKAAFDQNISNLIKSANLVREKSYKKVNFDSGCTLFNNAFEEIKNHILSPKPRQNI